MKYLIKWSKLSIGLCLGYVILVLFLWYDMKYGSCSGMFCEMPVAISSWPLGIEADMHNIENIFNLPLNSLAYEIVIFGQIFNTILLWIIGNWITFRKKN